MRCWHELRRLLYAYDPGLNFFHTFWRTLICMLFVFFLPYCLGPSLGLSAQLAIGAAGGLMPVTQQLAACRTRREVGFQSIAAYLGVLIGGVGMALLEFSELAQIALVIGAICLHFKWKSLHKSYGLVVVKTMLGAALMCLIVSRYVPHLWHFLGIYFLLTWLIFVGSAVMMMVLVNYPSEILQQVKFSLICAHELAAKRFAKLLREPTRFHQRLVDRAVLQTHRCAVATEAAMVGMSCFPAQIGEEIHQAAFDSDLTFVRLRRVIKMLADLRGPSAQKIQKRLAEVMELLSVRDPEAIALASDLAGGFRRTIGQVQADFTEKQYLLIRRIPVLIEALISEIVDGGYAHAEADAWINTHAEQLRRLQREQDNAWFLHPWLKISNRLGIGGPKIFSAWHRSFKGIESSWVPKELSEVQQVLTRLEANQNGSFETGLAYAELKHVGEGAAAAKAAGKLNWGPLAIGLAERQILQALVAVSLASVAGWLISGNHFFWASLGAFVVLIGTTTTSSRFRKTIKRVVGTALGAMIGVAIIWLTGGHLPVVNLLIAVVFAALAFTIVKISYSLFSVLLTATIMQVYLLAAAPLYFYALARVAENMIGALIAGVVASLIMPLHTSDVVRSLLETLQNAITVLLEDGKQILRGETQPHPLIDARNVENAAIDVTQLARAVLGTKTGTSKSWVRRVASHTPAVSNAVAALALSLEEIRAENIRGEWQFAPPTLPAANLPRTEGQENVDHQDLQLPLEQELIELFEMVLVDNAQLGVIKNPAEGGGLLGDPGEFVYQTGQITNRLQAEVEAGNPNAGHLENIVNELIQLDEAILNLRRMAWGS